MGRKGDRDRSDRSRTPHDRRQSSKAAASEDGSRERRDGSRRPQRAPRGYETGRVSTRRAMSPATMKRKAIKEGLWVEAAEWKEAEFEAKGETSDEKFDRMNSDL